MHSRATSLRVRTYGLPMSRYKVMHTGTVMTVQTHNKNKWHDCKQNHTNANIKCNINNNIATNIAALILVVMTTPNFNNGNKHPIKSNKSVTCFSISCIKLFEKSHYLYTKWANRTLKDTNVNVSLNLIPQYPTKKTTAIMRNDFCRLKQYLAFPFIYFSPNNHFSMAFYVYNI